MLNALNPLSETTFPVKRTIEKTNARTKLTIEIARTNLELTDFKTALPLWPLESWTYLAFLFELFFAIFNQRIMSIKILLFWIGERGEKKREKLNSVTN